MSALESLSFMLDSQQLFDDEAVERGEMTPYEASQLVFDYKRFLNVLQYIERNPEAHEQDVWAGELLPGNECQTVACFAGWTCILNGDRPKYVPRNTLGFITQAYAIDTGRSIQWQARTLLGLNDEETEYLFDSLRTLDEFYDWFERKLVSLGLDPEEIIYDSPTVKLPLPIVSINDTLIEELDTLPDWDAASEPTRELLRR